MRSTVLAAAFALLSPVAAYAATSDEYGRPITGWSQWTTVGNKPCRIAGSEDSAQINVCSHEWALQRMVDTGVLPAAVAKDFARQLRRGAKPSYSVVCNGDKIAIAYADEMKPILMPRTVVAFADRECTAADVWRAHDPKTGIVYRYFEVLACGNKGAGVEPLLSTPTLLEPDSPVESLVDNALVLAGLVGGVGYHGGIIHSGGNPKHADHDLTTEWFHDPDSDHEHSHDSDPDPELTPVPLSATLWFFLAGFGCWVPVARYKYSNSQLT